MTATTNVTQTATDWALAPASSLIDHILSTHHQYLKRELPRLTQLAEEAVETGGAGPLPSIQTKLVELRAELESHLWKEEMVLFPLITGLEDARDQGRSAPASHCGSVNNPIRVMEFEHEGAKGALAELRRLAEGYARKEDDSPRQRALFAGLEGLEADLLRHICLEDEVLFPKAAALEAATG